MFALPYMLDVLGGGWAAWLEGIVDWRTGGLRGFTTTSSGRSLRRRVAALGFVGEAFR